MVAEVKPLRSAVHRKRTRPTICSQPKDVSTALNLFCVCVCVLCCQFPSF